MLKLVMEIIDFSAKLHHWLF